MEWPLSDTKSLQIAGYVVLVFNVLEVMHNVMIETDASEIRYNMFLSSSVQLYKIQCMIALRCVNSQGYFQ